jgi:hypothetical protein
MALVYRSVGGRKVTKVIANNEGVQDELERRTFEIAARAEVLLLEHRREGTAEIDIEHGDVDWYVILCDDRGQKAALSIEYGRAARVDPETGEAKDAMDGLYILHKATHLPVKRKGKVRF